MNEKLQQSNKNKIYSCKCGKSYDRNSSLFNHIKSQHQNNKEQFLFSQSKIGRPIGQKDNFFRLLKRLDPQKKTIKEIQCKCGDILKGDGAFYNHINGKHSGDPFYKKERKQQGRKKFITKTEDDNKVSASDKNNENSQVMNNINEQNIFQQSPNQSQILIKKEEENTITQTQYEELCQQKYNLFEESKILNSTISINFLNVYNQLKNLIHYSNIQNQDDVK